MPAKEDPRDEPLAEPVGCEDAGQHSVPQQTSDPVLQPQTIVFGFDPSLNCIWNRSFPSFLIYFRIRNQRIEY